MFRVLIHTEPADEEVRELWRRWLIEAANDARFRLPENPFEDTAAPEEAGPRQPPSTRYSPPIASPPRSFIALTVLDEITAQQMAQFANHLRCKFTVVSRRRRGQRRTAPLPVEERQPIVLMTLRNDPESAYYSSPERRRSFDTIRAERRRRGESDEAPNPYWSQMSV